MHLNPLAVRISSSFWAFAPATLCTCVHVSGDNRSSTSNGYPELEDFLSTRGRALTNWLTSLGSRGCPVLPRIWTMWTMWTMWTVSWTTTWTTWTTWCDLAIHEPPRNWSTQWPSESEGLDIWTYLKHLRIIFESSWIITFGVMIFSEHLPTCAIRFHVRPHPSIAAPWQSIDVKKMMKFFGFCWSKETPRKKKSVCVAVPIVLSFLQGQLGWCRRSNWEIISLISWHKQKPIVTTVVTVAFEAEILWVQLWLRLRQGKVWLSLVPLVVLKASWDLNDRNSMFSCDSCPVFCHCETFEIPGHLLEMLLWATRISASLS